MALLGDFKKSELYKEQIEKGEPFEVAISNQSLAKLGFTFVLSAAIVILFSVVVKTISS